MDKSNRDHTIKVKINGENQSFQEETVKKEKDSFSKTIKISPELIEKESMLETAAAQESADESFDWIIPESSDQEIVEYKIASSGNTKKTGKTGKQKTINFTTFSANRNGGMLKSILLTVVFAVLIGTSFGVLMLKLVVTENSKPAVTEPAAVGNGTDKEEDKPAGGSSSVVLGAQTLYVLQGGAFTTKDAAKQGADVAKGKGAPAVTLGISEKEHLFLGVADSLESAKQLGAHYKADGFEDPFAKQISVEEKTVSDINESEKAFLESSMTIFQELAKATSAGIVSSKISDETINAISDQLSDKGFKNEKVKTLQSELSDAAEAAKKKNNKSLVEAQQHLLNFLTIYYSL